MKKPMVSVIVPIYNREEWIERCVDRLLAEQTYQDFEILLVDNGSTDNSVAIMKKCLERYPERIRVILPENEKAGLPADSRQRGLDYAQGKYFTYCDSDDRFMENGLQLLVECAEKNKADMVVGDYITVDESGTILGEYKFDPDFKCGEITEIAIYQNPMCQCRLYNLEFAKTNKIKFPVGKWFEDMLFVMEFGFLAKKIVVLNKTVYKYLWNPKSTTNQKRSLSTDVIPVGWFEELFLKCSGDISLRNKELFIWKSMSTIMEIVYEPAIVGFAISSPKVAANTAREFGSLIRRYIPTYSLNPYFKNKDLKNIVGGKYFYAMKLYRILLMIRLDVAAAVVVACLWRK